MEKTNRMLSFSREISFKRELIDAEKRECTVSFSSETEEVVRWFEYEKGYEILSHNDKAVDLRRLRSVGSFLYNHSSEIIGPIRRVWLDGAKGYAKVGFDETDDGEKRMIQVTNGSLKGMSFYYRVFRFRKLEPGEKYQLQGKEIIGKKDMPSFVAEKWEPTEISALPQPYDASVGIGRSLEGIEVIGGNIVKGKDKKKMGDDNNGTKGLSNDDVRTLFKKEFESVMPSLSKAIAEQVRSAIEADKQPKVSVSPLEMKDLVSRARAISPEATNGLMDKMFEGATEPILLRFLNDELSKKSDTNFTPPDGDGTQRGGDSGAGGARPLKDIPDDEFFNAIKEPGYMI